MDMQSEGRLPPTPARSGIFSSTLTMKKIFALLGLLSSLACTQAGASDKPQVSDWTIENGTYETDAAKVKGVAAYHGRQTKAILELDCLRDAGEIAIWFHFSPKDLNFDSNPFEGPSATATGPIKLMIGANPVKSYRTDGIWSASEKDMFSFSVSQASKKEFADWTNPDLRGKQIRASIPSTKKGEGSLVFSFALPNDDAKLRKVIAPCLQSRR